MDRCPYCKSENGVYTTFVGIQHYDFSGNPCGYDVESFDEQKKFARCLHCDRKISLIRIKKEAAASLNQQLLDYGG